MRDVKLVTLSEDGTHLVLTHEGTGEHYALALDDRLRSAVVSDRARNGHGLPSIETRLRPREIQARIRVGETTEDVAAAAGVSLERVLRYAGPVLAEREHMAAQARRCAVRRHGSEGPGEVLEQLVQARLAPRGVHGDAIDWDAWRSDNNKWKVVARYDLSGASQQVSFAFDPIGRVVLPADDDARRLIGEPNPNDINRTGPPWEAQQRVRLTAVPSPGDPGSASAAGEDADPEGAASEDAEDTVDLTRANPQRPAPPPGPPPGVAPRGPGRGPVGPTPAVPRGRGDRPQQPGQPGRPGQVGSAGRSDLGPDELADLDDGTPPRKRPRPGPPATGTHRTAQAAGPPAGAHPTAHPTTHPTAHPTTHPTAHPPVEPADAGGQPGDPAGDPGAPRRTARKRKAKRAVVPSWDEILFGAGDGRHE